MKDKKCSDFVFMPLKDATRGSSPKTERAVKNSKDQRLPPVAEADSGIAGAGAVTEVRSKIVVVGSCGCGKTALIHRYVQSKFLQTYTPTGFDTYNSQYSLSETYSIQMSIWDTSGDEGYDRVRPLSYKDADLVIICFAIDKMESMQEVLTRWYPEVKEQCPNVPVMLVGCKSDRRQEIKAIPPDKPRPTCVTYDQGLKTAKHINALVYTETSSKLSQRSVNDVMEVAALSSAGSKNGHSFSGAASSSAGVSTTTASNSSTGSSAHSNSSSGESPNFRRQRSFIRRKRFSGMTEAKGELRKEATKSCVVM
ncbi:rho-related GTP-binding protein rhoe [Plakobranchus ocellatus]|uniref:Rho-related GTP-binding protein rhoe n=1 Tax=Plakobranchus ocellatus TaxID=259542 RepID=A0AAV4C360_9GAST|nr:rho-related GTP-binding protein rhoe [Plakobranchus ocellatus]